ncbi:MAG TPA: DUF4082 domain-containing protein [Candidatus Didemnitutus sp.]|nr:DUF4082 domain-containing protein [Candidatus Didemnitutus sp.]
MSPIAWFRTASPCRHFDRLCRRLISYAVAATAMLGSLRTYAATVTVDGNTAYQTVDGFGVNANHWSWNPNELPPVLDALIDQAGMTLFRVVYDNSDWEATNDNTDSNSMNWTYYDSVYSSTEFNKLWDMSAYLNNRGIVSGMIFNFQGPGPAWMEGSTDPNQRYLTPGYEDEWAEMVVSLLFYARNIKDIQFQYVMPNNEPDIAIQGVRVSGASQYATTLHDLVPKLASNGLGDVQIIGPDLASTTNSFFTAMEADSTIMSRVARLSVHGYSPNGGGSSTMPDFLPGSAYPHIGYWVSETNVPCSVCDYGQRGVYDWTYCKGTAEYVMDHLLNNAAAVLIWEAYDSYYFYPVASPSGQWSYWGLFSIDDENAAVKTYTPRKNFYTVSQISKFVRPGAQRIAITGSTSPFSPLLAFKHPTLGQVTVVGINTSSSAATLSCTLSSVPTVTTMDLYYTSSTVNMVHATSVPVTNGSFSVTIPADCVFTLAGTAGVTVSLSSPANGTRYAAPASIPITATATTSGGSIDEVDLFNGLNVLASLTNAPYQYTWTNVPMGDYTLTAAANDTQGRTGVSAGVNVSVVGPLAQIAITPGSAIVTAGGTQQFSASATDAMGHAVLGTPVYTWSVNGGGSIDSNGKFTAGSTPGGPFTVTASSSSVSSSATVTVTSSGGTGTVGNTTAGTQADNIYSGGAWINAARFQAGSTITASTIMAKIGAVPGKYKCAVYSDSGGLPSTLIQTTSEVTAPATGWQSFTLTAPVTMTSGTFYWLAIWSNDTNAKVYYSGSNGTLRWASKTYGTWPNPISTTGGSNLNYSIYAAAGSGSGATLSSIAVSPGSPSITVGGTQQFSATGTYSDSSTQDLSSQVSWSSSNTTVATINATGLGTGASGGISTISAAFNGVSGSATLTVQPAVTLTSIAVTPANATVTAGATQQFTATGTYSNASTQNLTNSVTWSSSVPARATISASGLATGVSAGLTTISASSGGVGGSTTLTVQPAPLSISTGALAGGTVGIPYSAPVTASGGTTPYHWTLASGALPAGLNLDANSGTVAGTPTVAGSFSAGIMVTDSTSPAGTATKVFPITITAAPTTLSIWPTTSTPVIADGGADSSVELGVKFQSDTTGTIAGIRFYKSAANTGTHVGNLWSSTGTLLATATFTGESASGWQQVNFTTPVTIAANTVYIASYHVTSGHFAHDANYFASAGVNNAPLHALQNGVSGGNGVYHYGTGNQFPNTTWNSSNYWVDVVFKIASAPTLSSIAVTPANSTIAAGATQSYAATGTYSDGSTQNITAQVTWSSSNTGVATIATSGLTTGGSPGTTTISASLNGVTGSTSLTVQSAVTLIGISVTPSNTSVLAGATQQFTATGTYSNSSTQDLTTQVSWSSSNSAVAVVSSAGLATTSGGGSTTISATLGAVTGSTALRAQTLLAINTSSLSGATAESSYSATVSATGGAAPYSWSITSGSLPAGLALNASTGIIAGTPTVLGTSTFTVGVTDSGPPVQSIGKTLSIVVSPTTGAISLWAASATPSKADVGADNPVELGVKFQSDVSGYITGIRFYKSAANTGTHVANLWSATGTLVATGTFTNETTSGWQQANFSSPVGIAANTLYVASYHSTTGHFASDANYFTSAGVDNTPLHAPSDANAGGQGVFTYGTGSLFPTTSWSATNYWVDVVFQTTVAVTLNSIAVTPANPSIGAGTTQPFTATGTYSDNSTQDLSSQVTWASSNTSKATITSAGVATGVAAGTSTITATLGGNSGSTTLTVLPPPLSITTASLANGTSGTAYSASLGATGGTTPYSWSVIVGSLPTGLSLSTSGAISGTPTAAGTFSFTVQVADSGSPMQTAPKAFSVTISSASATLWTSTTVPGRPDAGADSPVELGMKFRSDVAGKITGIRFYKSAANTGTHVANLWSSTGTLLATATFSGETSSGWQQVNFATPVTIAANTTYIASYHCNGGHFSADINYFVTTGVDKAPLHAPSNASAGGQGVYHYSSSSSFPDTTWGSSNYWVDIVFSASP